MALPTFRSMAARRKSNKEPRAEGVTGTENNSERTVTHTYRSGIDIKIATKIRRRTIITACVFFGISVIFSILTIIGNINKDTVIRETYFFKLDLANIIPANVDNITFVNSLARSLGLHDFYQVGLWNFCEGYNDEGITYCSKPKTLYWFNPVEILLNELLSGATIALPANINNILNLIKIASHLMFGFFLTGISMTFVSIFITPVVLRSRWWSFAIALWTFIQALLTVAATIIATVMFVIFRNVITSQKSLNIGGSVGIQMFAFMWVAAVFNLFGFLIHIFLTCCCASERDVRTGRRKGSKAAYTSAISDEKNQPTSRRFGAPKLPTFGRKKTASEVV